MAASASSMQSCKQARATKLKWFLYHGVTAQFTFKLPHCKPNLYTLKRSMINVWIMIPSLGLDSGSGCAGTSTGIYCSQIQAGTGISMSVDQGPYLRPMAVLVYKSDVTGHWYYSGSNISTQWGRLCCRRPRSVDSRPQSTDRCRLRNIGSGNLINSTLVLVRL